MTENGYKHQQRHGLPPLGRRIVKTAVAVFLCLLFYYLRGHWGETMPAEAMITAIICLQPYMEDTKAFALNRLTGTLIGGFWGLAFLLFASVTGIEANPALTLVAMAIGLLPTLYTSIALRLPDTSGLAAIVYLCVVVSYPDISEPLGSAAERILGVLVGTAAAIIVNMFRLPKNRRLDRVFFVRTKDLVPNRFSEMSPTILYHLNYLYRDGIKLCLVSEHAPAFFTPQVQGIQITVPMIVMDGAAVYDMNDNRYIHRRTLSVETAKEVREALAGEGLSFFTYTIHRDKVCIFHQGEFTEPEKLMMKRMRRSLYRDYLEGEIYKTAEIVCFKVFAGYSEIASLTDKVTSLLPAGKTRTAVRKQEGVQGISALYIYSADATIANAEEWLTNYLGNGESGLTKEEIRLREGCRNEHDSMMLIRQIYRRYQPYKWAKDR